MPLLAQHATRTLARGGWAINHPYITLYVMVFIAIVVCNQL